MYLTKANSTVWLLLCLLRLTAASVKAASPEDVQPIDWALYADRQGLSRTDAFGSRLNHILDGQSDYLYGWIEEQYPSDGGGNSARYDVRPYGPVEYGVRPVAETAWGTSMLLKTGAFSQLSTGLTRAESLHRTEKMIRGTAYAHRSNNGTNVWGNDWQAALWAADTAEAAWFLWDELAPDTKLLVTNMVEHEADRIEAKPTEYWRNPNGSTNFPGDTKAEELAWNARVLSVAQAMLPDDPSAAAWREKRNELFVASYSRPSDLRNTELVDGKQVKDWVDGYNTFEEGVLVNHNFVHPDYVTANELRLSAMLTNSLAQRAVPESAFHNFDVGYQALAGFQFTPGPSSWGSGSIQQPGGASYRRGPGGEYLADLYYPQGTDWSPLRYDIHLLLDLYADELEVDAGKSYDALGWADARITAIQQIQDRPGLEGDLFYDGEWLTNWRPQESYSFKVMGQALLLWWMTSDEHTPLGSLRLNVNVDNQRAAIVNPGGSAIDLNEYHLTSDSGALNPQGWSPLQTNPNHFGWQVSNATSGYLSEHNESGGSVVSLGGIDLGNPVALPPLPAFGISIEQLPAVRFEYATADGEVLSGVVDYSGLSLVNNLMLTIDPSTGEAELMNSSQTTIVLRGYSILSESGSLKPDDGGWNSLSDQSVVGFQEANASASALSELSPSALNSMTLFPGETFHLGEMFDVEGSRDLQLEFLYSEVAPLAGDYNDDGVVDIADYTVWRDNLGGDGSLLLNREPNHTGSIDATDYTVWKEQFGAVAQVGAIALLDGVVRFDTLQSTQLAGSASIPEPSAVSLLAVCLLLLRGRRMSRWTA